ncbi:MAG: hypothetical protein LBQ60_12980 [Bacteroidales bacterium]|nr:hypothetical protein [Bacteroidales bacterium]
MESLFDTLCFNGEKYFFRHTPLVIKKGYTNIIPEMFNFRPIFGTTAHKGYRFLWCIRNDSLYIADIHPAFQGYHKDYQMKEIIDFVPRDTIISRLEAFSGSNFREGLLFIDWINGDFPVVKANPDPPETKKSLSWKLYDTDYLYPPLIFSFKNGLIVGIKEDKKGIKDLKKIDRKNNH